MHPQPDLTRRLALTSGGRPRLLIVDPDLLTRWALSAYLDRWFDVYTASSVAQAEEILSRGPVHAVVLPEALGDSTLRQIEDWARAANGAALVIHTGTQQEFRPRASGIAFLEKPFDLAVLARMLCDGGAAKRKP